LARLLWLLLLPMACMETPERLSETCEELTYCWLGCLPNSSGANFTCLGIPSDDTLESTLERCVQEGSGSCKEIAKCLWEGNTARGQVTASDILTCLEKANRDGQMVFLQAGADCTQKCRDKCMSCEHAFCLECRDCLDNLAKECVLDNPGTVTPVYGADR